MLLFVGLGNPGPKYESHRHNIGFMVIEELARVHGFGPWRARFQGLLAEGTIGGHKVLALKPMTYMNESGRSVGEAVRFFKLPSDAVTVFYDELDLLPGKTRVKTGGGAGGHNGIRSIDAHIGKDYRRVRIGIGHPGDKNRVHGYVLGDFAKAELPMFEKLVDAMAASADALGDRAYDVFMTKVSLILKPPRPKPEKKPVPDSASDSKEAG